MSINVNLVANYCRTNATDNEYNTGIMQAVNKQMCLENVSYRLVGKYAEYFLIK